ncbi:MAG: DivIVA domain-containing protein [Nitrospinota bacterium]|nr:DivIVA domain-containing protein [Nitrospinota bacterium]MDH5789939.1 DivIVA domain-containing protein [Nitrospinota bacterium]
MKLDHETILAQTFKKSLRGYDKEEVHDFLKIVAKDFKEMKRDLTRLREELNLKDRQVRELDEALTSSKNQTPSFESFRTSLQEKARKFVNQARDEADRHRQKVEAEVNHLQTDISRLKAERQHLIDNLKAATKSFANARNK